MSFNLETVCFFINGFTRTAFVDLGKTPRDNELLTIFVTELIRTYTQSFTSHVGKGSTAQKALDDIFSNCLISVSVKGSNVSIMDMQDSFTNVLPVIRCWKGTQYVYLIFLTEGQFDVYVILYSQH